MFALLNYMSLGASVERYELELLERKPRSPVSETPLLFVHGAYAGAWCWDEHFLPYFADAGYHAYAVSLRGHGGSAGREQLNSFGLGDYVRDLARTVAELERPPVLIGHSMGGMVIQKYLERQEVPAAVLMASVPPNGLCGSAMRMLAAEPMLALRMSLLQAGCASPEDLHDMRRAIFSDDIDEADLERYTGCFQTESQRALWDMTVGDLPQQWRMRVPPMLVLGAADDALFSTAMIAGTALTYGAELEIFPRMAHGMMLERGWEAVADRIIGWLQEQAL